MSQQEQQSSQDQSRTKEETVGHLLATLLVEKKEAENKDKKRDS